MRSHVGQFRQLAASILWLTLPPVKLVLKSPDEAPYEAGRDFSVVIACEDSTAATSACEVLELVERNLADDERVFYQWWNFEVLAIESLREQAAAEAATADMIIIDVHAGLPEPVTDWMHQWLDLRNNRPGALVAVLDSDLKKSHLAQETLSQLKQVSEMGHMNFFASGAMEVGRDARVTRKVNEVVRQIRHAAQAPCAKRVAGRREVGGGNVSAKKRSNHIRL